jgi:GST-like protein
MAARPAVARGLNWGKDVQAKSLADDKEAQKVLFNQRAR